MLSKKRFRPAAKRPLPSVLLNSESYHFRVHGDSGTIRHVNAYLWSDKFSETNTHVRRQGCALQPSCPLTGLLLATGGPLPYDLRHGQWVEPTLALIASNHREYTAQLQLWTERLEVDHKRATRTPNLYRGPLGFEVGSPVVVGNQHDAAHTEEPRSLDTDGDGRISRPA